MTRIVKGIAVAVLTSSLAIVGLPLGGGSAVVDSTGCCKVL